MKVILNKDLAPLGEEGDVKDVAKGYARNFLFPKGIALPYTDRTLKALEARKGEIEARKQAKRTDAASVKERLESLDLIITMPAGANGKLYGAVTSQTLADELGKQGFQIERKRIELAGTVFKSVGRYKAAVKLYENVFADLSVQVQGQTLKTETKAQPKPRRPRAEPGARAEDSAPEKPAQESASPEETD
ncbi:MAG: 50S ribosomal protein L9 [Spirochaetaceae bacterium]|nr:50S ribosomal protein L9 [Spirochaetaceae bacterium]